MQPSRSVRFSDNSNAQLCGEVEWIVALSRHFFFLLARIYGAVRYYPKLLMDFRVRRSIGHAMDERELRGLFTEIGSIMEDASVTALVWERGDKRSISDRAGELRGAYQNIGTLIDTIEASVR